jgi:hypothetical protein
MKGPPDALAHFFFVSIIAGRVNVPIAMLNGLVDHVGGGVFVDFPCTECESRHDVTCHSETHVSYWRQNRELDVGVLTGHTRHESNSRQLVWVLDNQTGSNGRVLSFSG